jgi:hypothetical protein
MNDQEILTALRDIKARIDGAFDEDADKWMRDKQLALEEVDRAVDDLIDRLEGQ